MQKQLVNSLLRIVQSPEERFVLTKILEDFAHTYNLGWTTGRCIVFSSAEKEQIRVILRQEGIHPEDSTPGSWQGLTRAERLQLGNDEKFGGGVVKHRRVSLKALPGQALHVSGAPLDLPPRAHLDMDYLDVAVGSHHTGVLVIENWECFNDLDRVTLDLTAGGRDPIVIWRGEKDGSRADSAMALLARLDLPVWAFVDWDPAGLMIARSLPRLSGIIAPPPDELERMLEESGIPERYQVQLPASQQVLDSDQFPIIAAPWQILRKHGKALPQEHVLKQTGLHVGSVGGHDQMPPG